MGDSKKRSIIKTVSWRTVAIINSYLVLVMMFTESPLWNALIMNFFGIGLYYIHERVWNKIKEK
jgi:putative flippase GtrA